MVWQVVQEYERAVIFRLGRLLQGGAKGPGELLFKGNDFISLSAQDWRVHYPPPRLPTLLIAFLLWMCIRIKSALPLRRGKCMQFWMNITGCVFFSRIMNYFGTLVLLHVLHYYFVAFLTTAIQIKSIKIPLLSHFVLIISKQRINCCFQIINIKKKPQNRILWFCPL